ncbi:MAG TPA: TetR/AcrR family transcriptional regulator [Myxococcales bacterium]|nr:TetR/AcrR family transcriptional regulator [Myxococcales bacterium]HIL02370.1 TetR/AcrR family transcriptional regulator [Myxococcales bacterium]
MPPRNSEATGAKGSPTAPAVKAQTGRVLGPRALQTRQRLLVAAAELFRERSALDLSVAEIARRAGTSAATFYQYFADVEEAALHLARQAAEEMPAVLDLIDGPWQGEQGLVTAQRIVEAFMHHWEAHHAVLLIRNLAADHGDPRFQEARRRALSPFLERLAERVAEFQAAGRVSDRLHPFATAAALGSVLERLSAHTQELEHRGVDHDELLATCAGIIHQVVTGGTPSLK